MTSETGSTSPAAYDVERAVSLDLSMDEDDGGEGDAMKHARVTCNGIKPNTGATLPSHVPSSPLTRKKNVSTLFSSNHRRSWQFSLSNYSEDTSGKDAWSSCESGEPEERPSAPLLQNASSCDSDRDPSPTVPGRCNSTVVMYSHDTTSTTVASVDRQSDRSHSANNERGGTRDLPRDVDCTCAYERRASGCHERDGCENNGKGSPCRVHSTQEKPSVSDRRGFPLGRDCCSVEEGGQCPGSVLTWCHNQEPHRLRHHSLPSTASHNTALWQSSVPPDGEANSIELSMYQTRSSSPSNPMCASKDTSLSDSAQHHKPPSQNCKQSTSVSQPSGQVSSGSISSQRKRHNSDGTVSNTSVGKRKDSRHKRQTCVKDRDGDRQVHRHKTVDTGPDTQPLLPATQVVLQDRGGNPESPGSSCQDNLHRFHSVDGKAACSAKSSRSRKGISASALQRAVSVNAAPTCPLSDNLALVDASRPLVDSARDSGQCPSLGAPPLHELYRYHVFLSHCAQDVGWVQETVARLGSPPYNYLCMYTPEIEPDDAALEQSLLCGAMLSERVVLVVSAQYVAFTWPAFERVLRQLTQMSVHNQHIMGVLLDDCRVPDSLAQLDFLHSSQPDFFHVFSSRLRTGRLAHSSESVSSDLAGSAPTATPGVVNGQTLAQCTVSVKIGWDSFLQVTECGEELPPTLKSHGINLEKTEFYGIVHNVTTVLKGSNKLPWVLCVQPLVALLVAAGLWLPAFIAVFVVQVDDQSGMALPVRLVVFVFPLAIVSCGYLLKWRRRYWLSKLVRVLVQNCMKANQVLYCQGRPVLTTASHVRANNFAVYFIYFDLTDCVRSVDLVLFTCLEADWDKLMRLVEFYAREKAYLSQVSMSERLTVMMAAAYLLKLVRGVLPQPPQQRHVQGQLCLCQFTEECVTRFVHALDREDVTALTELFTRHLFGYVSGSAVHRINTDIFHRLQ